MPEYLSNILLVLSLKPETNNPITVEEEISWLCTKETCGKIATLSLVTNYCCLKCGDQTIVNLCDELAKKHGGVCMGPLSATNTNSKAKWTSNIADVRDKNAWCSSGCLIFFQEKFCLVILNRYIKII